MEPLRFAVLKKSSHLLHRRDARSGLGSGVPEQPRRGRKQYPFFSIQSDLQSDMRYQTSVSRFCQSPFLARD